MKPEPLGPQNWRTLPSDSDQSILNKKIIIALFEPYIKYLAQHGDAPPRRVVAFSKRPQT